MKVPQVTVMQIQVAEGPRDHAESNKEVQISFEEVHDQPFERRSERHLRAARSRPGCTLSPYISKAGRTKPKCRKTRTSVHKCKAKCKAPREKRVQRAAADETVLEVDGGTKESSLAPPDV